LRTSSPLSSTAAAGTTAPTTTSTESGIAPKRLKRRGNDSIFCHDKFKELKLVKVEKVFSIVVKKILQ
jgi:hypothetical protein